MDEDAIEWVNIILKNSTYNIITDKINHKNRNVFFTFSVQATDVTGLPSDDKSQSLVTYKNYCSHKHELQNLNYIIHLYWRQQKYNKLLLNSWAKTPPGPCKSFKLPTSADNHGRAEGKHFISFRSFQFRCLTFLNFLVLLNI